MEKDPAKAGQATAEDLEEIRKELRSTSEKVKALEVRVANVEQNLLGN